MYIVILAGGSGTRFWPLSRSRVPKQLMSIMGGESMLQRTVERVLPLEPTRILIVTNREQALRTEEQIHRYRARIPIDIVAEPAGKNTAPAIALAARIITLHDPSAVMAVLPADHFIRDEERFRGILCEAAHQATNGWLVTIGITPTRPETGYGYIEADRSTLSTPPFPVLRFVEKPHREKALEYIASGAFSWNSGMFVWKGSAILAELERHAPDIARPFLDLELDETVWDLGDLAPRIESIYGMIPSDSIDYAVMEKSANVCVYPAEIGWSDVGSWGAIPEILPADSTGNVTLAVRGIVGVDSTGSVIHAPGKMVALVGVENLVVVDTPDALLVGRLDRSQEVRQIVDTLRKKGEEDLL